MAKESSCVDCGLRKKYDTKPKSLMGRFWRWHINFCPGWKDYMTNLDDQERIKIAKHYNQKKYMN